MQTAKERSQAGSECPLSDLMDRGAYREERQHVFRSDESLRYFLNKHRADLFERGALIEVGGRLMIRASVFDAALPELTNKPRQYPRQGPA